MDWFSTRRMFQAVSTILLTCGAIYFELYYDDYEIWVFLAFVAFGFIFLQPKRGNGRRKRGQRVFRREAKEQGVLVSTCKHCGAAKKAGSSSCPMCGKNPATVRYLKSIEDEKRGGSFSDFDLD